MDTHTSFSRPTNVSYSEDGIISSLSSAIVSAHPSHSVRKGGRGGGGGCRGEGMTFTILKILYLQFV